jgi:hypothetical protein
MRIDKVNVDLYFAVPDEIVMVAEMVGQDFTPERTAANFVNAVSVVFNPDAVAGVAVQSAATLTEDEWQAAQAMLAQGCGHCENCKARAAIEAEWADTNGITL